MNTATSSTAAAPARITEADRARVQKRTLTVVMISQILGGAGLAAGISVGALIAQDMLGTDALSGVPTALFTLGSALAAFLVGQSTQKFGRRRGLGFGFIAGGLGAAGVIIATTANSIPLLFIALFIYGAGTSTNLQARYAGADLALPEKRGFGASMAMVATTVGAVAGPNLIEPLGGLTTALGIPELAGPFLLATVAFTAAGLVLVIFLRPDPYVMAQQLAAQQAADDIAAQAGPAGDASVESAQSVEKVQAEAEEKAAVKPKLTPKVYVGGFTMVLTHAVMVAIMTMTPVHMSNHDHTMGAIGWVIGLHVAAMWLPSLVTGTMTDKWGRGPMVVASGLTLLASGLMAALAPVDSIFWLTIALILLGLGWNFGLVAGTALVVDGTVPANRAKTQGKIDVLVALAGAAGGMFSGAIMFGTSYQALAILGGVISLAVIVALLARRREMAK